MEELLEYHQVMYTFNQLAEIDSVDMAWAFGVDITEDMGIIL
jgi:hypothetical protein